jgi:hypothetical protein
VTTVEPQADTWRPPSWRIRIIAAGLVAAGVGVLGLTGGLAAAPPPAPAAVPEVSVGTVVDSGPWRLTPRSAVAAMAFSNTIEPHDKNNYLLAVGVLVDVRGPDSESSTAMRDMVSLPGLAGLVDAKPGWVALARDASQFEHLNPGLPELVGFIFEVREGTSLPAQVTVQLNGYSPRYSFSHRSWEWDDFGPRARASITINDLREPAKAA